MMRVQTNSLPDHCYSQTVKPLQNLIDFTVALSAQANVKPLPVTSVVTQAALDALLCDSKWPDIVDTTYDFAAELQYQVLSGNNVTDIVGVAFNGVPILPGTSELGFDAFLPKTYNGETATAAYVDYCLGSSEYHTFYHYYSFSPCIYHGSLWSQVVGKSCSSVTACASTPLTYMTTIDPNLVSTYQTLIPIGISRIGWLIYGPYDETGTAW